MKNLNYKKEAEIKNILNVENKLLFLTPREQEIFTELMQGMSNTDIGKKLIISKHTVKAHVTNIIRKFNAKNRTHAVSLGLVKILGIKLEYQEKLNK